MSALPCPPLGCRIQHRPTVVRRSLEPYRLKGGRLVERRYGSAWGCRGYEKLMATTAYQQAVRALGHQHWIPKGRMRLLRLLAPPNKMKPDFFEVDFYGKRYSGYLSNFLDWMTYFQGGAPLSELALLDTLSASLPKPFAFYDVGANVGHHSLFMASRAQRVIGFEPYSQVRAEAQRKMAWAGADNVEIHPFALGAEEAELPLNLSGDENQGTSSLHHVPDNSRGDAEIVRVRRGDAVRDENVLPPIGLLKIDVEGFESAVLHGLRGSIERDRPPILMEISGEHRSGFANAEDLRSAVYPGATIFEVHNHFGGYALAEFDFKSAAEVLILPADFPLARLPRRIADWSTRGHGVP
jgi:FkbM family methyltransferase